MNFHKSAFLHLVMCAKKHLNNIIHGSNIAELRGASHATHNGLVHKHNDVHQFVTSVMSLKWTVVA